MADAQGKNAQAPALRDSTGFREVLPKAGLVFSEKANLNEILCKPKIMPLKSVSIEKIEQMAKDAANAVNQYAQSQSIDPLQNVD